MLDDMFIVFKEIPHQKEILVVEICLVTCHHIFCMCTGNLFQLVSFQKVNSL